MIVLLIMTLNLCKNSVLKCLFFIVGILIVGNLVGRYIQFGNVDLSEYIARTVYNALDFNTESNFPTLFSSLLLFSNSILLFIIANGYKSNFKLYNYWLGLAIVFSFLGLDEMLHIHEHLVIPVRSLFDTSGYLYFAWLIPYLIITAFFGLVYLNFFRQLPSRTLKLFTFSAILFLSGAVGLEAVSGSHAEFNGEYTITYFILYTIEESLEMLGSIVFLYALLDYKSTAFQSITIKLLSENNKGNKG
ncbi:hypothetical protein [Winogradskyella sp.]|uniref:hypothetical protein n=1 Tax=Winogradskyella sp. TaxID=1883156 RepID=UPI003F6B6EB5